VTLPTAGGSLLGARGTVAQAQTLFAVHLSDYRTASGETYYAPGAVEAILHDLIGPLVLGNDIVLLPLPRLCIENQPVQPDFHLAQFVLQRVQERRCLFQRPTA
jgi:hypothetical protein